MVVNHIRNICMPIYNIWFVLALRKRYVKCTLNVTIIMNNVFRVAIIFFPIWPTRICSKLIIPQSALYELVKGAVARPHSRAPGSWPPHRLQRAIKRDAKRWKETRRRAVAKNGVSPPMAPPPNTTRSTHARVKRSVCVMSCVSLQVTKNFTSPRIWRRRERLSSPQSRTIVDLAIQIWLIIDLSRRADNAHQWKRVSEGTSSNLGVYQCVYSRLVRLRSADHPFHLLDLFRPGYALGSARSHPKVTVVLVLGRHVVVV